MLGAQSPHLFCVWSGGDAAQAKLNYWSSSDFKQLVSEKLTAYEREHHSLNIVLFDQVSLPSLDGACRT